ncbi:MAG: hypothetical protein AAF267_03470 [Deinococcota bacterium]
MAKPQTNFDNIVHWQPLQAGGARGVITHKCLDRPYIAGIDAQHKWLVYYLDDSDNRHPVKKGRAKDLEQAKARVGQAVATGIPALRKYFEQLKEDSKPQQAQATPAWKRTYRMYGSLTAIIVGTFWFAFEMIKRRPLPWILGIVIFVLGVWAADTLIKTASDRNKRREGLTRAMQYALAQPQKGRK